MGKRKTQRQGGRIAPGERLDAEAWLTELESVMAAGGDADGMTVQEMADAQGRCVEYVRRRLRILLREDRLVRAHARRVGLDGVTRPVPVYRIKGAK